MIGGGLRIGNAARLPGLELRKGRMAVMENTVIVPKMGARSDNLS